MWMQERFHKHADATKIRVIQSQATCSSTLLSKSIAST